MSYKYVSKYFKLKRNVRLFSVGVSKVKEIDSLARTAAGYNAMSQRLCGRCGELRNLVRINEPFLCTRPSTG